MKCSKAGKFYGKNNETIFLNGVILDDSDYLHDRVDWHYHENAYFTFILEGSVLEGNKKEVYECSSGSLVYHNWEDPHYNVGSKEFTRGFHVEIEPRWFSEFGISKMIAEGSINIADPKIKMMMYSVLKETKLGGNTRQMAIDALLIQIFDSISGIVKSGDRKRPAWVSIIRDVLHELPENWGLSDLAKLAGIHPVHLSREFPKYFHSSLGDYCRMLKVQKALTLLPNKDLSLTDISIECGFADQSHFIRSFKSLQQLTPHHFRKLLNKGSR